MQYRMNYEIEDLHSILENRDAWIPSEDSSDRRLLGYTLWLGSAIRAYVAGIGASWAAWVFTSGVDFSARDDVCYQYTSKKVMERRCFKCKADAMLWCETMTRMGD